MADSICQYIRELVLQYKRMVARQDLKKVVVNIVLESSAQFEAG